MLYFAGYILGILSSPSMVIISLLLGTPLSIPFLILNVNPKITQPLPIIYCTAAVIEKGTTTEEQQQGQTLTG